MEKSDWERYSRHILLKEIGGPGQVKLSNSHVVMIGAGGLGSIALYYLVASGVGKIKIIDDDVVSLSNLQRQILFRESDIGQKKVLAGSRNLHSLNPTVEITAVDSKITIENYSEIFANSDLIIDGTDNFDSKALICRCAYKCKTPLIFGGLSQWEGQICVFEPRLPSACFDCIFPNAPKHVPMESCSDLGIMGPTVGVIGSLMASEAIKILTLSGKPIIDKILTYDCLEGEFRKFEVVKRKNCPVCS